MGFPKLTFKIWIVLVLATLLSSCGGLFTILSTETELSLGGNQSWSIQHKIVLPAEAEVLVEQYQGSFDEQIANYRSEGVNASWIRLQQQPNETNISYLISLSGQGFDTLNQVVFDGEQVILPDHSIENQVGFHHIPRTSPFMQGRNNIFTLKSANIITSNGQVINSGKVQWVNPSGEMTAVVTIGRNLTLLWIILLGIGGIGFIIAGLGISGKLPKRHQKAPYPSSDNTIKQSTISSPEMKKYCPQCGVENPKIAGSCINCGFQFPSQ